ncbi:unnamed protein product, partial [Callosobruchus maculatus]
MISSINMSIRVLVVSDTRSSGDAKDTAGPKLMEKLHVLFPYAEVACNTIPDDKAEIKSYLQNPRDVTPEATREVIEKEAPGLATAMMFRSLAKTEMAMLSRAVCGVASKTLIVNLPARNRESPYPMVEEKDASDVIIKHCMPIHETDTVPFEESFGRVLAENVCTPEPIPAFRASIKDGYAVKSADGAPVPPGADAVVQVEDTKLLQASEDGSEEIAIEILKEPKAGQDIRDIGSEVAKDSVVLHKYDRIDAAHIGIMAQLGKLEEPWERIQPGQIRDSNRYTLKHMLRKFGFHSMDCGIVKDDPNVVKQALEKAFEQNEYVITTGGASMGEFDVVKRKLKKVFCLPGNPASCSVCCLLFVIPALRYVENQRDYKFPMIRADVPEKVPNSDARPDYRRVTVEAKDGIISAYSNGNQISSNLNSPSGLRYMLHQNADMVASFMTFAFNFITIEIDWEVENVERDIQKYLNPKPYLGFHQFEKKINELVEDIKTNIYLTATEEKTGRERWRDFLIDLYNQLKQRLLDNIKHLEKISLISVQNVLKQQKDNERVLSLLQNLKMPENII